MTEWMCVCCRFMHSSKKELLAHLKIELKDIVEAINNYEIDADEIREQIKKLEVK